MSNNPIKISDRIKEISYTMGTGNLSLDGPAPGFSSFASVYQNNDKFFYAVTDGASYEIGSGIFVTGSSNQISRFPIKSSNNNLRVSFGEGVKEVYVTYPASHAVYHGSGIGSLTAPTKNNITFWASDNILDSDSAFVWDKDLHRLGIHRQVPDYGIHLGGNGPESIVKASGFIVNTSGIYFPPRNNGDNAYPGGTQLTHYVRNELDNTALSNGYIGNLTGTSTVFDLSGVSNQFLLFKKQNAGLVFAGPPSGCTPPCSPGYPSFRQLTLQDVPAVTELSGILNNKIFNLTAVSNSTALNVSGILNNKINSVSGLIVNTSVIQDGDKGDILVTGSGSLWTIDTSSVTTSKVANSSITPQKLSFNLAHLNGGRLTLEANTPVSNSASGSSLHYTNYNGSIISLYNTSNGSWDAMPFTNATLQLSGLSTGALYDVFAYNNNGFLALELGPAWFSPNSRALSLALQNGVYCKSNDLSRKYIGTIRASASNTTQDTAHNRFVWNAYNRVPKLLYREIATGPWTYSTAAWRQVNATQYAVEMVNGLQENIINLDAGILFAAPQGGNTLFYYFSIAKNGNLSPIMGSRVQSVSNAVQTQLYTKLIELPVLGYSYYYPIEFTSSSTAATLYGGNTGSYFGGIQGIWEC